MGRVIKHATGAQRMVQPPLWRAAAPLAETQDPVRAALEAEIIALKEERTGLATAHEIALKDARKQAYQDAQAEFVRDEAKALAALETGIKAATADLRAMLSDLESLSLLLCETALVKVFANVEDYRPLIANAIRRQCAALTEQFVLGVRVSSEDFTDEAALKTLADAVHPLSCTIVHDTSLPRGSCRIKLQLGELELSLGEYWRDLSVRLQALAERERPG
jgi:flagellar biosynthesis/type III secretory pathway protein FliH